PEKNVILPGSLGPRLAVRDEWSCDVPEYMQEHGIKEIQFGITTKEELVLVPLISELNWLEGVQIVSQIAFNPKPLEKLSQLRFLSITAPGKRGLDYHAFPKLEHCTVEMCRRDSHTIFDCLALRRIMLEGCQETDFQCLGKLTQLEQLEIAGGKLET